MPLIDSESNLDGIELSIVIPAFNEEKRLLKTIGKIINVRIIGCFFIFVGERIIEEN